MLGLFLYWLIGQFVLPLWWRHELDYTLDVALLTAILFWFVWPFFAICVMWRFFGLPSFGDIVIWRK